MSVITIMFEIFPEDVLDRVLKLIQSYLSCYDYRQLVDSNVKIFQKVRQETIFYPLRGSVDKYPEFGNLHAQKEEIQRVLSNVKDRSNQVGLKICEENYRAVIDNYGSIITGLRKVTIIEYGDPFDIAFADMIDPVQFSLTFRQIHDLVLVNISELLDLESLEGIRNLEVHQCFRLRKIGRTTPMLNKLSITELPSLYLVEDFSNIHHVMVAKCPKIQFPTTPARHHGKIVHIDDSTRLVTDWAYFNQVESLTLYYHAGAQPRLTSSLLSISNLYITRTKISDFGVNESSTFRFMQELSNPDAIKKSPRLVLDLIESKKLHLESYDLISQGRIYPNLEETSLEGCLIQDLKALQTCAKLSLESCSFYSSVTAISFSCFFRLKEVRLVHIDLIIDLRSLAHVKKLTLHHCRRITDVSSLGVVHTLDIADCRGVRSLEGLGKGNSRVTIYGSEVEDFSPLQSVYQVTIINCPRLSTAAHFRHVKHLTISHCSGLNGDLSMLGGLQSFRIAFCPITNLRGLKSVPVIEVLHCPVLESIEGLGENRWVKITFHPQMKQPPKQSLETIKFMLSTVPYVRIK